MEGVLAVIFIFGGGALGMLSFSPIGRALAARIQGKRGSEEVARRVDAIEQWISQELGSLRRELGEVQERVDFAERLLAQRRPAGDLPRGDSPA